LIGDHPTQGERSATRKKRYPPPIRRTPLWIAEGCNKRPAVRSIADNQTFAGKAKSFLNSFSRSVLQVRQIEFSIQQGIGIAAVRTQVFPEYLRSSIAMSSQDECLDWG
jgi:hypothetical protein